MTVRRVLGPLALVMLLVAVSFAVYFSSQEAARQRAARAVVVVHGLIGSEEAYLRDPRVLAQLRKNGFDLRIETSGSRDMVSRTDLTSYDFAFPAGEPPGQRDHQSDTGRYVSIVLMTDGENNRGDDFAAFERKWHQLPAYAQSIHIFPIFIGEASPDELNRIAALTGGRSFDARTETLSAIFKEIRGYQ